jgi:hypothetical protein
VAACKPLDEIQGPGLKKEKKKTTNGKISNYYWGSQYVKRE